ncbi:MAG: hypothetical protein WCV90_01780 [Candidatus Woesearchaeota archaeon]|jgi:diadenosine tetraphosphate (Ap4A) HIT family hydrolase
MDYEQFKIDSGQYWDIFLHTNQELLGRSYFWYKGEEEDLMEIPEVASLELMVNGKRLQTALTKLFHPDKFDYFSFNYRTTHLHFHVLPRYEHPRHFADREFIDPEFGRTYHGKQQQLIPLEVLLGIKDRIAGRYLIQGR